MDLLTIIQFVFSHLPQIAMYGAGGFLILSQGPTLWTMLRGLIPSKPFSPSDTGKMDNPILQALNSMMEAIPQIKNAEMRAQAVEACIKFAESMIREVGEQANVKK